MLCTDSKSVRRYSLFTSCIDAWKKSSLSCCPLPAMFLRNGFNVRLTSAHIIIGTDCVKSSLRRYWNSVSLKPPLLQANNPKTCEKKNIWFLLVTIRQNLYLAMRATFSFNLSRNIVALQVEMCFCAYYHRVASCSRSRHEFNFVQHVAATCNMKTMDSVPSEPGVFDRDVAKQHDVSWWRQTNVLTHFRSARAGTAIFWLDKKNRKPFGCVCDNLTKPTIVPSIVMQFSAQMR